MGQLAASRNGQRLARLRVAGLLEAEGIWARADATHFATVARHTELEAGIAVGRLVGEVTQEPNVPSLRIVNFQGI